MTRLTVNNQAVEYRLDPATPLLWALRDASNLTGTKYGCGTGHCGACTVDVDGRAVRSCRMTIAQAEGTVVTTIEDLSREREHPLQLAFLADPPYGRSATSAIQPRSPSIHCSAKDFPVSRISHCR